MLFSGLCSSVLPSIAVVPKSDEDDESTEGAESGIEGAEVGTENAEVQNDVQNDVQTGAGSATNESGDGSTPENTENN